MPWVIDLDGYINKAGRGVERWGQVGCGEVRHSVARQSGGASMTLRRPTPAEDLYAWHRKALAMPDPDRGIPNSPCCGWYKRKLVRHGPWVPARIWCYQPVDDAGDLIDDESLQCEVNSFWADPYDQWSYLCGNPITEAEWRYLEELRQWTAAHAPDDPMNTPRQRIDLLKAPIPFGGRKP